MSCKVSRPSLPLKCFSVWGNRPNPPLITLLFVSGLAHPDYLMEIEAVAVIPEE